MEKMRVVLIILFLFVVATIGKEVDTGKAINPARDADKGETINELNKSKSRSVSMLDKTEPQARESEREAHIGETSNPVLKKSQPEAYESSKLKRLVTYCNSNVANACSSGTKPLQEEGGINHPHGLALCLFDFMERCLVDHGASLYKGTPTDGHKPDEPLRMPENNFPYLPDPIRPSRKPPTFPTSTSKDNHQGPQFFDAYENNFPYLPDPIRPSPKPPTFPTSTSKDNHEGIQFFDSSKKEPIVTYANSYPLLPDPISYSSGYPPIIYSSKDNHEGIQFFDSSKKEPIVTYANSYPLLPDPISYSRGYPPIIYSSKDNHQSLQFFHSLTSPASTFKYEPHLNTRPETPKSIPIETIKFRTVLRTCTQVSAQSCYTTSAVEKSLLAACLTPSMNQCMNSYAATLGDPPFTL